MSYLSRPSRPCTLPRALIVVALIATGGLSGCKILPIQTEAEKASAKAQKFDAKNFADTLWTSKGHQELLGRAVDLATLLPALDESFDTAGQKYGLKAAGEGSPTAFVVKGEGRVTKVDTASRAGTATLSIATPKGNREATLQTGPIVKGNAIRDNLPDASFGKFTNQIEYAQAGRALNEAALATAKPGFGALVEGANVTFTGAITLNKPDDALLVMPIAVAGAGQ
ncbi:DUF2291 domain-containing protein [Kaistia dalseonensis]|uniref:Lipoprotein n=1 Tax=Kaistia dalseonensis TaxID=410840 RepID=A0ABU0HDR0_9HYPH|nr:DUF2291 domain-containing protein [Kaistia dalseonensis]MCX5497803.1 DUF2291 domain-containing protein [Kaistia dalseonensis]MDQ0440447.1 putative lipoprotein [Kaistia dalseonensis]